MVPIFLGADCSSAQAAQPALDQARAMGPLTVFPDAHVPGRFYYVPGPLRLAEDDGHPAVRFLITRRTGTRLTGDQGETRLFAHLTFDIEKDAVRADMLAKARQVLTAEGVSQPELRLLPIRRTEAQVVFAPLAGGAIDTLPAGDFENLAPSTGTISERRYTLRLDRHTAEAMWKMLESERTMVSFSYAYVAEGVVGSGGELEVEGDMEGFGDIDDARHSGSSDLRSVRADAFEVMIDPERNSDMIRVVDLSANRAPPPWHGVLDIRCYDFRNGLRPDLAMKMVELEAEAANGRTARKLVIFRASEPDEAVHRLRFPFAVRLEETLRYRVREITTDGEELDLGWQERPWIGVLDVTTPQERLETETDAATDTEESP
ncbi:MAG: hypothetical protein ABFS14_11340 [Gemmatimonadota bacterium]